jgi:hypothetical protein
MIDFKRFLNPLCAICNKDVDKVEWVQDFCTMTIHAKAYCHGDTQVSSLTQDMIENYCVRKGIAFMDKRINSDKAFDHQVEPQIGLTVEKYTEAKNNIFNKEQELFYRATDYRGS